MFDCGVGVGGCGVRDVRALVKKSVNNVVFFDITSSCACSK